MKVKVVYTTTFSKVLEVPSKLVPHFNNDMSITDTLEIMDFFGKEIPVYDEIIEWEEVE